MQNLLHNRLLAAICLIFAFASQAFATHNRAGEIRVEQQGNSSTVVATIVTYTAVLGPSQEADRDSLLIGWGDGDSSLVFRVNGPIGPIGIPAGDPVGNNLQRNVYVGRHTYSNARGSFAISVEDPNRIADIRNIDNSINERFFLRTVFTFLDANFQGPNSTPILLQPPIDDGCVDRPFTHNPNAFDPDGDSLAYRLGVPLGRGGLPIDTYRFPGEFTSSSGSSLFQLDEVTGTLTWDRPREAGSYNTVILIISYRGGIAIDTTLRDMQIFITECENNPPVIEVENEFCLIAGDTLVLDPIATAPLRDSGQQVRLEVTSAALDFDFMPATWTGDELYHPQPFTARFRWETACEHSDRYPYNVIFKATDDFASSPNTNGEADLSWLEVVRVKVSPPPPEDLQINAGNGLINLSWAAPYACENAMDSFFYGFSVWRREGSNPFAYDSCVQGLAGRGYTRVELRTTETLGGRYVYTDDNIERGRTYCYRVLGQFVRYTQTGRPFNLVESIPSVEICTQSSRDLPLLTRVDITNTGISDGSIDVRWTPPLADDLDTLSNTPPYTYEVLRSAGIGTSTFSPVAGTLRSFSSFAALERDTQYVDQNIDTESQGYTYAIRFTSNGSDNGIAPLPSSSEFLQIASSDRTNVLSWDAETSWENILYHVLRENLAGGFDTLISTRALQYVDQDLTNGEEYCYLISAVGTYGVSTIYDPLINRSQRVCGIPIDTVPPCPPDLFVSTICDDMMTVEDTAPPFPTDLSWEFISCPPTGDLVAIRVYEVSDSIGSTRNFLAEVEYPLDSALTIENPIEIANCYALTAVDSVGNESALGPITCVPNCPLYVLPNVITPNADGQNDVLTPRVSRFVERVEFVLFNRWGAKIYETTDPTLGWDGTNANGEQVTQGTYFYTCLVYERKPGGTVELVGTEPLEGFIEVLR